MASLPVQGSLSLFSYSPPVLNPPRERHLKLALSGRSRQPKTSINYLKLIFFFRPYLFGLYNNKKKSLVGYIDFFCVQTWPQTVPIHRGWMGLGYEKGAICIFLYIYNEIIQFFSWIPIALSLRKYEFGIFAEEKMISTINLVNVTSLVYFFSPFSFDFWSIPNYGG